MAEDIKEQKLQTMALERITALLETANTATGGSNKEEAEERAEQKKERAEANQRRREEARQRIQQMIDNNKLFKMTAQGFKGLQSGFAKFGSRIADGFKSLAAKGKEVAGSAFDILKKIAFVAGLGAIYTFLNSPYFVQLKDFIVDTVVPALAKFYNDTLKPAFQKFLDFVIPIIKDVFNFFVDEVLPVFKRISAFLFEEVLPIIGVALVDTIENFKELFTDIVDAFDKILSGDFLGGISDLVLGIGRFVLEQIDIAATGIYNIIASLFGLEETDSIAGSIAKFFTDIYNNVVEAVTGAATFVQDTITNMWNNITGFFGSLFDTAIETGIDVGNWFAETVSDIFDKITNAIMSIIPTMDDIMGMLPSKEEILDFLNPFSDGLTDQERNAQRLQEIDQEIAQEQARIDRSQAGENEYFGSEEMGIRGSNTRIERLRQEKAELEADEMVGIETKPSVDSTTDRMSEEEQVELAKNIRLEKIKARMERKRQSMGEEVASAGPPSSTPVAPVTQVNMQQIDNSDKSSSTTVTSSPIVDQNPMVRAALGAY